MKSNEKVHFRLIQMPCCGVLLCCVNPRLYNYCPECGKRAYEKIREGILVSDENAWLKYNSEARP